MSESPIPAEAQELMVVKDFLEKIPPRKEELIGDLKLEAVHSEQYKFTLPTIELYCVSISCKGILFFDPLVEILLRKGRIDRDFVRYICRNCKHNSKVYALQTILLDDRKSATMLKLGEQPSFGSPTPRKVLDITGDEKEYFLKGRQSENQGLGIAAFAYYRRVVENQKNKILDEIIRVADALAVPPEMLADLMNAKNERQFSKAIESIKHGIPQALMIQGHNPLTLLHDALSEGMHAQSDEDCLALATSIRTILSELVEKISFALKEEAELNAAVGTLLKAKAARASKAGK